MTVPLYQVDAFTNAPFSGNPAAVVLLEAEPDAEWMQRLAEENNLSETAYIWPRTDGFGLRWFTPATEVNLCGHATLASAHVLWESGILEPGASARFLTHSGWLECTRDARIEMDFPARQSLAISGPDHEHAEHADGIINAIGAQPVFVGRNVDDYLVVLKTDAEVRSVEPDFGQLRKYDCRGVIVTAEAAAGASYDFVSRFFAPAAGVQEDPVTGSAHCALAPYWAERLGRSSMVGYQASARGGKVHVRVQGNRVILGGDAVTIFRADLAGPASPSP